MSAEYRVGHYSNIYLTNSGIALKGIKLVKASVFGNVGLSNFYKYAIYKRLTEPKINLGGNNNLVIHNHWSSGYHHWITESLVRLVDLNPREHNLIIPEDYPAFAFDCIETYGFRSLVKLPSKTGAFLEKATIPPNPDSGFYDRKKLLAIKDHFFKYYNIPVAPPVSKIYITRKNAPKRKIENEVTLLPVLKKYGFEVLDADRLSFADQVKIFSSCKYLISIHGAALTNCIFMGRGSKLIEFYKSDSAVNHCYERMSAAIGIDYVRMFCKGGANADSPVGDTDLVVDIEEFSGILNELK